MNKHEIIVAANEITIQRLLTRFLSNHPRYSACEIAGASIISEPSRHRTGVPEDAQTVRYVITNVTEGWSFVTRAVWREGRLYAPTGTHTRIESYADLANLGGDVIVADAVNRWLVGLDL